MQKTKGISLIVLAITIIVMIILAGTVIITLMDQDIIERAETTVKDLDIAEVQSLAELKWSDAYIAGKRTKEELTQAVKDGLTKELGEEVVSRYEIVANDEGVDVYLYDMLWLSARVDTVPIPKGFVASGATGENKKNGGLVIYEGTDPVTDANVEEARRTRNQYVWVPISREDFKTKFVRKDFANDKAISNVLGQGYWEVALDSNTNMPLETQDMKYIDQATLDEVKAMYNSVYKYEGFYIARYETRGFSTSISMEGRIPDPTNRTFEKNVETARKIYPSNNEMIGVVSTLVYGVQWDSVLQWWLDTEAVLSVTESTLYGNYKNHEIKEGDLNSEAQYIDRNSSECDTSDGSIYLDCLVYGGMTTSVKYDSSGKSTLTKGVGEKMPLSRGALKSAKINNIYDMAGNFGELTMERNSADKIVERGGSYADDTAGVYSSVTVSNTAHRNTRIALYIK